MNNNTVLLFFFLGVQLGSAICPCIPMQQIMLFNEKWPSTASEANSPCLGDIIINASEPMDQLKPDCAQRKGVNHGPPHTAGSAQTLGCSQTEDLGALGGHWLFICSCPGP